MQRGSPRCILALPALSTLLLACGTEINPAPAAEDGLSQASVAAETVTRYVAAQEELEAIECTCRGPCEPLPAEERDAIAAEFACIEYALATGPRAALETWACAAVELERALDACGPVDCEAHASRESCWRSAASADEACFVPQADGQRYAGQEAFDAALASCPAPQ